MYAGAFLNLRRHERRVGNLAEPVATVVGGIPPIHLRHEQRRIDPVAVCDRDIDQRIQKSVGKKMGLKTKVDQLGSANDRAETIRRNQIELAMLPAGKYPRVVECAGPMTACDDPEFHYSFGIELVIDGCTDA